MTKLTLRCDINLPPLLYSALPLFF